MIYFSVLMMKKTLTLVGILTLGIGLGSFSFASSGALAQTGLEYDASFKTAVEKVAGLRISLFDFKTQLEKLDKASKEQHSGEFDAQYKEMRAEIVKVIQNIDYSTTKITRTLKALYKYKQDLQKSLIELKETQQHLEI